MLLLIGLLGCKDDPPEEILAACGNGVVEDDEQCDDGAGNSNEDADACRTSCRLPACGDAVADAGEGCDDGNPWGGDGCDPGCAVEGDQRDIEPNDSWDAGQAITTDALYGSLTEGDIDCFTFEAAECESIAVQQASGCEAPMVLALHDPTGAQVAASAQSADCAVIDPAEEPGARFVAAGQWAVCAAGLLGGAVPAYSLLALAEDSANFDLPLSEAQDFDADGLADECDGDRDGDGLDNDEDNCPDIPNGPGNIDPTVDGGGFIRHWLTIGPFTGSSSAQDCLPTELDLLGEDASAAPALGDGVDSLDWLVHISGDSRIDFLPDYSDVGPPREVYGATYVYSDTIQDLTFALGPDDGARVWLNGAVILEVSGCQGTNVDQFTAEVTLQAGWNRLLVKVYDQGGGWGTYARFLDDDGPVTGLALSLSPDGGWDFDQTDSDGDGIGDVCD